MMTPEEFVLDFVKNNPGCSGLAITKGTDTEEFRKRIHALRELVAHGQIRDSMVHEGACHKQNGYGPCSYTKCYWISEEIK
jgi:hypothetical protein